MRVGAVAVEGNAGLAVTASPADDLRNIITNGKDHMPKYRGKLTAEEIDTLVKQIRTQPSNIPAK